MSDKRSKLVGFFSGGPTSPRREKDSSSEEDEYGHLLDSKKSPTKRRISNTTGGEQEYAALKEAAAYNARILERNGGKNSKGSKSSNSSGGSSRRNLADSLSSVSRKEFLKSELRVAKEMKEQHLSCLRLESQMASLLDIVDKQQKRIEEVEDQVRSLQQYNIIHEGHANSKHSFCLGDWF